MLYIFGGLPGTGKSALAMALARRRRAVYLRIDTIEQALRDEGIVEIGPKGYVAAQALAADNLRAGAEVVADSVNPIELTRAAWRRAAGGGPCVEIEIVCSDATEHRRRVEARRGEVPGLVLPTWRQVVEREYAPWEGALVIDTAGRTVDESLAELVEALGLEEGP